MSSALPVFADKDVRRVVAAAALTGSEADGEALAAVRATNRLLALRGVRLADVVAAGLKVTPARGYLRDAPRGMTPVTPLRPHQLSARMCLAFPEMLTEWELEFLGSVADQRHLSERQKDRLNAIAVKVERGRK